MRTTSVSSDTPLVQHKAVPSCSCQHTNTCLRQQSGDSTATESSSRSEDNVQLEKGENCCFQFQKCISAPKIIITLCLLCVLFSIGSGILTAIVFQKFHRQTGDEKSDFCLPCSHFLVENGEKRTLEDNGMSKRIRDGDGVEVCCGKDHAAFEAVLNQYLEMKIEDDKSQDKHGLVNNGRFLLNPLHHTCIVAHMVLEHQPPSSGDDSSVVDITNWRHQPDLNPNYHYSTVIKQQITYIRGRLIIAQSGLYYVYSQIHFLEKHPITRMERSISHYIHKVNQDLPNGGDKLLLQNSRSRCNTGGQPMEHSSYIGAVVKLDKGDQVYVKVNNIQAVHAGSSSCYFGLYLISKINNFGS